MDRWPLNSLPQTATDWIKFSFHKIRDFVMGLGDRCKAARQINGQVCRRLSGELGDRLRPIRDIIDTVGKKGLLLLDRFARSWQPLRKEWTGARLVGFRAWRQARPYRDR
jgi:hypothetical protein